MYTTGPSAGERKTLERAIALVQRWMEGDDDGEPRLAPAGVRAVMLPLVLALIHGPALMEAVEDGELEERHPKIDGGAMYIPDEAVPLLEEAARLARKLQTRYEEQRASGNAYASWSIETATPQARAAVRKIEDACTRPEKAERDGA